MHEYFLLKSTKAAKRMTTNKITAPKAIVTPLDDSLSPEGLSLGWSDASLVRTEDWDGERDGGTMVRPSEEFEGAMLGFVEGDMEGRSTGELEGEIDGR